MCDASNEIDVAEKFIDDLISGRLNIKDAFNKYKE